jgi:hypothetical protein
MRPIHVFVRGSLPGLAGMRKIDICTKVTNNPFMICKLIAVVSCDRMDSDRKRLRDPIRSIRHGLSGFTLDLSQEGKARLPLDQGDNDMVMSFAYNHIHFPITQALAGIHDSRSLVDTHPIFELSTLTEAPVALTALFPWSGSSTGIVDGDGDLPQRAYP